MFGFSLSLFGKWLHPRSFLRRSACVKAKVIAYTLSELHWMSYVISIVYILLKGEVMFLPTCITTLTRCCENTCALKIADI